MTDQPNRQPKGVPTGGQFSASAKTEADLRLTEPAEGSEVAVTSPDLPAERACFGCDHQHDPNSSGACYEATCLPGCSACHEQETIEARDKAIAKIVDAEARQASTEFASRYALPPRTLDYEPQWTSLSQTWKPARDIAVGDRLPSGRVVTGVEERTGVVYLYCDGRSGGPADVFFNHGDPVNVHEDRVDLSDPDWFEIEAHRIATGRIVDEQIETGSMSDERRAEITTETRRTLSRVTQPTNISPLFHDGPNVDPRIADGRAKIGDNVIFSQPMYGDSSYEVLGKRARRDITGHDGTSVTWGENGDVDYVLRDITSGHQTTSNLRGAGWKRIAAPGDHGPAAQRTALR